MPHFNTHRPHAGRRAACIAGLAFSLAVLAVQPLRVERNGLVYDGVPAPDAELSARLARYLQSRGARFLDWLADGSLLVALPVGDDSEQLFRVPRPMSAPEQLSELAGQPVAAAGKAYEANSIVVARFGADGATHLYLLDASTHQETAMPAAGTAPAGLLWAHDGRRLAYQAADSSVGNGAQLYVLDTATGAAQRITAGDDWRALDWSLDDRKLLAMHTRPGSPAELMQLDTATLQTQALAVQTSAPPARGRAAPPPARPRILAAHYGSDRHSVLVLAAAEGQPARLWRQSIDTSEPTTALTPQLTQEVERFDQSADGRYVAYSYNEGGFSRLAILDQRGTGQRLVSALPGGSINALKFDRSGARLAVTVEGPGLPAEIHVLDLASLALVRWTKAELGPLAAAELSVPGPVRVLAWYPAATRLPPALVYRPARPSPNPHGMPVLISLPETGTSARVGFDAQRQALVNTLGCALIVPTLRADTTTEDSRDLALRDVATLLVWIGQQPDFDRTRIAVEGTAASAPVALTMLALFGDRLRGAIVSDIGSVAVPAQTIERPVLLLRGASAAPAPFGVMEQLMWRLRVAGNDTWVLATSLSQSETMNRAQLLEAARVRVQFLRGLFSTAG
jgi:dipeptidyl aminopeptidase/acylaminoacyl peptidase